MKLLQIESLKELRDLAPAWDDLWFRSELALPTLRAELLAQWLEHFASGRRFVATLVEIDGQLVAALPLTEVKKAGVLRLGQLPSNSWSASGDLLLDPNVCNETVLDLLASGLRRLPWAVTIFDEIETNSNRWQTFSDSLHLAGLSTANHPQYHVGVIDIDHDWEGYKASWSSNHRHAVRKSKRRLEQEGETRLVRYTSFDDTLLTELLSTAFEIEDRSWKGDSGTSILGTPGMLEFFLRQARQLAEWEQLEMLFLEHRGQPIAFEYCYVAKDTCLSHKIGYDPEYRQFGPGRLLRYLQLQEYFTDSGQRLFDTLGILCSAKAKWCTRSYPLGRLVADTGSSQGRALMKFYRGIWPFVRKLRGTDKPVRPPKLGATVQPTVSDNEPLEVADGQSIARQGAPRTSQPGAC